MGFLMQEVRAEVAARKPTSRSTPRGHIPLQTMKEMGCRVCPQKDCDAKRSRLDPEGPRSSDILVLWGSPTESDGDRGRFGTGVAADEIIGEFKRHDVKVRQHGIIRCPTPDDRRPDLEEIACCRGYVEAEIEEQKPRLIVSVGDDALKWVAPFNKGNALAFRGRFMPVKVGRHVCWLMPLLYPNYAHKQKRKWKNEYELTTIHDVKAAVKFAETAPDPVFYEGPYDKDVTLVTGQEAGDFQRLEDRLHRLLGLPRIALDYETNGLRPFMRDPKIWACAVGTFNDTVAFAVDHPDGWGTESRQRQVRGLLGEFILQSPLKFAHNLYFEQEWTNYFWGPRALRLTDWEDTMCQAFTLDGREGTKGLGPQTRMAFGFDVKEQSPIDPARFIEYPIRDGLRYNGMDSKWTDKLSIHNDALLDEEPSLRDSYNRRVALIPALVLSTAKGVPVDQRYANNLLNEMSGTLREVERDLGKCPEVREYERSRARPAPSNSSAPTASKPCACAATAPAPM